MKCRSASLNCSTVASIWVPYTPDATGIGRTGADPTRHLAPTLHLRFSANCHILLATRTQMGQRTQIASPDHPESRVKARAGLRGCRTLARSQKRPQTAGLHAPSRTARVYAGLVPRRQLKRIGLWTLTVGSNSRSMEPTRRLAAFAWTRGSHLQGPSAHAKHRHLLDVFRQRGHRVFVEAGTYHGETAAFFVSHADDITSVELHDGLYSDAVHRFAGEPKVVIVHGDALEEVPRIVANASAPPLVFLDGHCSGAGTATGEEMEPAAAMLPSLGKTAPPRTTVVIDDLRLFGSGLFGFPQLDTLTAAARESFPKANIRTGLDSVVIENP